MIQDLHRRISEQNDDEVNSDSILIFQRENLHGNVPRPCYYMLRILGLWQPKRAWLVTKIYNGFTVLLLLASVCFILLLTYVHKDKVHTGEILNSIGSILVFCCPFVYVRYYFYKGSYDRLILHVQEFSTEEGIKELKTFRYAYTIFSLIIWIVSGIFFTFHWLPFLHKLWHYIIYAVLVVFITGWWATWLSLYGFVCHVHRNQIYNYKRYMEEKISTSMPGTVEEKERISHLLFEFSELHHWLDQTQRDFSKIISLAVAYHIIDIFVFSFAYWQKDFGQEYPIWNYIGTLCFDFISILIKLYPAAVVCQALHRTVISAGDQCTVVGISDVVPYTRIKFYHHLSLREQDMGFCILGVKITLKLIVGIVITVITLTVAFLRLIFPD